MANKNTNLHKAKQVKDDEFYTTYESIEKEMSHYLKHFENKTVLCNCDDPLESNFCKYFIVNFNELKLKRLICTSYGPSKVSMTKYKDLSFKKCKTKGYKLDISSSIYDKNNMKSIEEIIVQNQLIVRLNGNGDFQSEECVELLKISDIVVTNPPFSLFKEIVSLVLNHKKEFLFIGSQNALLYKEIFPLIQRGEIWTGFQFGEMKFRVPKSSTPRSTRYWVDEEGNKWRSLGNAMWLTNIDNELRHKEIKLKRVYNPIDYPKYDNFDAINVKTINDIPDNYYGIMGVPITFINRFNKDQFEIVGEANHGSDNEFDLFKPTINGKEIYKRILIRRVKK